MVNSLDIRPDAHDTNLARPEDVAVARAIYNSRAQQTNRTYKSRWNRFHAWCMSRNVMSLPAEPANVARYLATLGADGYAPSTIRGVASTIAAAHDDRGVANPCAVNVVRKTLSGLMREHAKRQKQARAMMDADLGRIRMSACTPRVGRGGKMETDDMAMKRGMIDIALVSVMRDAGLRRSEAASLVWDDVERYDDGSGRITIQKSKTDQDALGAVVAITGTAMRDLENIRPENPDGNDSVFGMSASQICRRIQSATKVAGLPSGYSGHSPRVGLARKMVRNAAPHSVITRQGRWKKSEMVDLYTRNEAAGEALRWLE